MAFYRNCRQHEEYLRRTLDYSEDSTQPASANSSVSEGPNSPLVLEPNMQSMEADVNHSQEVESLKRLLQEVCYFTINFLFEHFHIMLIIKFIYFLLR